MTLEYFLVDVFTKQPFSGNGLTIFPNAELLDKKLMQVLTQEMRQFESIFYQKIGLNTYRAYIFTMEEELDFAGHPILGLASQIHNTHSSEKLTNEISITLNEKTVEVTTHKKNGFYSASMNQGKPEFIGTLESIRESEFLSALNLADEDKYKGLKLEIVSTGLPYLIIPVKSNSLSKVKVTVSDLEKKLSKIGAKFFYMLDIEKRRGRT